MVFNTKWLPAIIAPAVISSGLILAPLQANAVNLPDLSAAEVILLMENSKNVEGFSGSIVKTTNLGLPALELSSMATPEMIERMQETMPEGFEDFTPQVLEQSPINDAIALIAGTHKFRVYASKEGLRVQLLEMMGQRDIIINKTTAMMYDFDSNTVHIIETHMSEPKITGEQQTAVEDFLNQMMKDASAQLQLDLSNPSAVVDAFLSIAGETADITVGKDQMVAGRTAYQLIVSPLSANSLVDRLVVSVDSETGFVLDAKIFSVKAEKPALHVGFTSIDFASPDAALFDFTPPPGATVVPVSPENEIKRLSEQYANELAQLESGLAGLELESYSNMTASEREALRAEAETSFAALMSQYLMGENWDTVVVYRDAQKLMPDMLFDNPILSDMLIKVEGGSMFSTPLMNVYLTDAGDVYAGAVTIEYLMSLAE